jgi:hypothetical protein
LNRKLPTIARTVLDVGFFIAAIALLVPLVMKFVEEVVRLLGP